jgi:hypothetical protein
LRAAHSYDAHIWRYASQLCAVEGISYAHDMWYAHIWRYARQLCGVRISGAHICAMRASYVVCAYLVRISGAMRASYAPLKGLAMRMICGIIKQNCKGFGNLELEGSRPNPFPFSWPICSGIRSREIGINMSVLCFKEKSQPWLRQIRLTVLT